MLSEFQVPSVIELCSSQLWLENFKNEITGCLPQPKEQKIPMWSGFYVNNIGVSFQLRTYSTHTIRIQTWLSGRGVGGGVFTYFSQTSCGKPSSSGAGYGISAGLISSHVRSNPIISSACVCENTNWNSL